MLERLFRARPYELQFWGYELGNVVAALAATGSLTAHWAALRQGQLLWDHTLLVDLAVPLGLALLIAWVAFGTRALRLIGRAGWAPRLNGVAAIAGALLLGWAFYAGENWLSTAAVAFLTGSALIRLTDQHPVLLQFGAVFLVFGGLALATFGVASGDGALLDLLTALTGIYVAGAGVLTYVGGAHLAKRALPRGGLAALQALLAPLNTPADWLARRVVHPAVFWVSEEIKSSRPFLTSMWARLPFRMATALAAVLTFTPQGYAFALANLLWAVGDIAIGALDWPERVAPDLPRAQPQT